MSSIQPKPESALDTDLSLASLLGAPKLLPEESLVDYQAELTVLIGELNRATPLAMMLTEQLLESLRWARRHSEDKACVILNEMAYRLDFSERDFIREALYALQDSPDSQEDREYIEQKLISNHHTLSSLRAEAVSRKIDTLKVLDARIRQHLNTVRHIQKSLEALELKPRLMKRLDLQIESLERDLNAIEQDQ